MSIFQSSTNYKRKLDKSQIEWNARLMKDLVQQYASILQNENQQSIINQIRILLNLECGSDSTLLLKGSLAFKQPQTAPIFQAQHEQQSQIKQKQLQITNEQQNNQNELRQNLNNDLYNRKQSVLSGALGLGTIGLNKSPIIVEIDLYHWQMKQKNMIVDFKIIQAIIVI